MKILVSGGAGYIGSHTSNLLNGLGYDITVIDNLSTGFKKSLHSNIEFLEGDITDTNFLTNVFTGRKFNALIHFAAKLVVPESIERPLDYYKNNVSGSLYLFLHCIKNGLTNIVFSSTAAVYGKVKNRLVSENDFCEPITPYGNSKLFVEKILVDLANIYEVNAVILRYFNVAGADLNFKNGQRTKYATHLIKVAAEAACGKRDGVKVFGTNYPTKDGSCIRDYIHVLDLADAHVRAVEYLEKGGQNTILNCGYGKGTSVFEVLNMMQKVSGKKFSIINDHRREGDPISLIANNTKIISQLQWTPKYDDLEVICKAAYEWEKEYVD